VEVVEAGECVSKVGEVGEGFELKLLLDGLVVTGHKMAPELNNKGEAAIELATRQGHVDIAIQLLQTETIESEEVRSKPQKTISDILTMISEPVKDATYKKRVNKLIQWAVHDGLPKFIQLLRQHDLARALECEIVLAAEKGHLDMVQSLIEQGVNPNAWIEPLGTPLVAAAGSGHTGVMTFLLSLEEVNPNRGDTPLMKAIRVRSAEAVALLLNVELLENRRVILDAGYQIASISERWYSNPLHLACRLSYEDMAQMLLRQTFIDRGLITVDYLDANRRTPFSRACGAHIQELSPEEPTHRSKRLRCTGRK
jgi:hypothetical protein